jgi:hypothetical protein
MLITDNEVLLSGIYWVVFRFSDDSKKIIRTTLDSEILGDNVKKGCLFDFLTQKFISLERLEGASLEIYDERPDLMEVDWFGNKYIL